MDNKKIILDTGSGYTKIGFSNQAEPQICIPTAIARPINSSSTDLSCVIIGNNVLNPPKDYSIDRPMYKGTITDWDLMEKYWSHLFKNELKIDINNSEIFMTEKFKLPKTEREKKAEIFFENFNVSSMFISNGATTTLWGSRVISGFLIDFGYDYTQIIPMRNGFGFKIATQECDIGGKDINQYLKELLIKKDISNISEQDLENIKIQHCFCKNKNTSENELNKCIKYKLSNDMYIDIDEERYLSTQILFTPLFGKGNIFNYLLKSLYEADNATDSTFRRTVVVSGGNSLFSGFETEFTDILQSFEKMTHKINVIIKDNRQFLQFFGASEHSAESYIGSRCMSKKDYEEWGASGVHHKFFYL